MTDFGIARVLDRDAALTRTGVVMGTFAYMAPEIRTDSKRANERSDLYAAGLVLYVALTCREPFDLYATNLHDAHLKDIPGPLRDIIVRVGSFRPEDRYASADQMREALATARVQVATKERQAPDRPPEPVQAVTVDSSEPHPTSGGATTAPSEISLPPPVSELRPFTPFPSLDGLPFPEGTAPPQRAFPLWILGIAAAGLVGGAAALYVLTRPDPPAPVEPAALVEPLPVVATPEPTPPVAPVVETPRKEMPRAPVETAPEPRAPTATVPPPPPAAPTFPILILADPIEGSVRVGGRTVPVAETVSLTEGGHTFDYTGSGWTAHCNVEIGAGTTRVKFTKGKEGCRVLP